MKKFTLLGAAAILFISLATSVMAQQVISEPGYCAVLSQRELSECGTKQSIYGRLSAQNLAEQCICFERCLRAGRYILPGPRWPQAYMQLEGCNSCCKTIREES